MDDARFDAWTRRHVGIAAGSVIAVAAGLATGERVHAKKKKKPNFNQFGCVNVGGRCRGRNRVCCSGICQGKKPKKGEKDKRRCVGHDATSCQAGKSGCVAPPLPCTTSTGNAGACFTTTGNAGYCRANSGGVCTDCVKDVDCQGVLGSSAACVVCTSCPGGTMCGSPTAIN